MKLSTNNNNVNFRANKMAFKQAELISTTLKNSKFVDLICHDASDRDTAKAALGMWKFLTQKGIQSRILLAQNPKSVGIENQGAEVIRVDNSITPVESKADTVMCLDFSQKGKMPRNIQKVYKDAKNVLCFDHHIKQDMFSNKALEINKPLKSLPKIFSPYYIDTSAKSTTSIVYRFFEALGEEIDEDTAYNLFTGFVDDAIKRNLVKCDGIKGEIIPTKALKQDKNAYEVYRSLESKIPEERKAALAKEIDIMNDLTPQEKEFQKYLHDNLQFTSNGKVAFVEIPLNDEMWEKLGKDNSRTSTILNRFRQEVLSDKSHKNLQMVFNFYEAQGNYRLSVHSNKDLGEFYTYTLSKLKDYVSLSVGGHLNRGGGKIYSRSEDTCHQFVEDIVKCANIAG